MLSIRIIYNFSPELFTKGPNDALMGANLKSILTVSMHRKFLCGVLLVIFIGGALEVTHRMGWFNSAEDRYDDVWHQVAGLQFQPQHVVIVAIDDQMRLEHQDEPLVFWSPYFARALAVIRQAVATRPQVSY